jgi:hypothetical protein
VSGDKVDEEPAAATFAINDEVLAATNALANHDKVLAAANAFANNDEELANALAANDEEVDAAANALANHDEELADTKNTRAVSKKITLKVFKNKVDKV